MYIDEGAFQSCANLTTLTFKGATPPLDVAGNVNVAGNAFIGTTKLGTTLGYTVFAPGGGATGTAYYGLVGHYGLPGAAKWSTYTP
jgi:hypothetical protein